MCTSPPQQEQSVESVDGEAVTSQQPRSPSPHLGHSRGKKRREEEEGGGERGERESLAALEAAEQQMILIHDEYKKLLREKEDEILQLKSVIHQEHDTAQSDVDGQMMRKDLAVHKEMVAELRQELTGLREQFTDKEKELKDLYSKAEGKFNRLKTQAKTKIRDLTSQLERLREEQGASPQLNLSATQVLDSSLLGEEDSGVSEQLQALQRQLTHTQGELEERKREEEERQKEEEVRRKEEEEERSKKEEKERIKELERVREEKKSLQQQVDSLRDKLNVSEVCFQTILMYTVHYRVSPSHPLQERTSS
jgi:DNA repair exonuclease SbcCD ATPase subunit